MSKLPIRKLIDLPVGTAFKPHCPSHGMWGPHRLIVLERDVDAGLVKYGAFAHSQEHWTDGNQEVQLAFGDRLDDWVRKEYT